MELHHPATCAKTELRKLFFYSDLTKGLIHQLSHRDFHVTVFLAGDSADETVSSLRQEADECIALPEDVPLARQIIADADLDVLVYPEIGMDPLCHALAFARLAPVQCALWGHPVTTGIPTIDHFISSARLSRPTAASTTPKISSGWSRSPRIITVRS